MTRQLGENVGLFALFKIFQKIDRVIGFQLEHRLCHLLIRHGVDDLVAHWFFQLAESAWIEVFAQRIDKCAALIGSQMLDKIGKVGIMDAACKHAKLGVVVFLQRIFNRANKVTQQCTFGVAYLNFFACILHGGFH